MQKKPHALLVGNFSNNTGYAWVNIYRLYNSIARLFHENDVGICLSFSSITPPITTIDEDVPVKPFVYDPLNVSFLGAWQLMVNIKKYNIKYVYATDLNSYHWTYPVMRLLGVKYIIIHNRVSSSNPYPAEPETGLKWMIKSFLTRVSFINTDKIYCVSDFTKHRLIYKHCIPEKKVVRILNGIDINKFKCPIRSPKETVDIFVGARATLHKGIHVLLEAAYLLINDYKVENFRVYYAGDGPDMVFLRSLVQKYNLEGYVVFLGEVEGTQKYVCNSDIIVVPSIWGDACPSSVSEALAAGKPLVTSYAGGIPEIIGDSTNAIIVAPGDSQAMARELDRLIKSEKLRNKYGRYARLRAETALDEKNYYSTVLSQLKLDFQLR